jgi:hypothetical protein
MRPSLNTLCALIFAAPFAAPAGAAGGEPAPQARFVNDDTAEVAEVRRVGGDAIERLAITLVREVSSAIAKGGPEAAVDVCHLKDLPIIQGTVAGLQRITAVKRTSLKLRNPANAPDAADQLALDFIRQQLENGDSPAALLVQRVEAPPAPPEWRVYKPLGVSAKCLACHGDPAEQSPALRAKLNRLYPADQATGYNAREWRGLIRVTVADTPAKKP